MILSRHDSVSLPTRRAGLFAIASSEGVSVISGIRGSVFVLPNRKSSLKFHSFQSFHFFHLSKMPVIPLFPLMNSQKP